MNDPISRQAAIDALIAELKEKAETDCDNGLNMYDVEFVLKTLPTIEPVKHGKWNVIKKRPMDEEERKEWSERLGYDIDYDDAFIYANLPDDGETVLICSCWGAVMIDTFRDDDGCYFEDTGDMDGIVAWMRLPDPYKGGEDDE